MPSAMQPDDPGAEQPFISHLVELRDRMIRMLIAVGVVVLLVFPFANGLYSYVAAPLLAQLPEGNTMIATQVASPFLTPFKLALVAAVFLAMPYLLYQVWAFVAPGLYQHEKRLAVPLLVSSILLFYVGMAFAYFVVFPLVFGFMAGTTPAGVEMMTDISAYLDFVLTLFFAFGLAFEIPIATILLVAIGAVTPEALARKRPYVIVGVFVVGMLLTPPDVISQTLLAVPMWLLFELGIVASRILLRHREKDSGISPAGAPTSASPPTPKPGATPAPNSDAPVGGELSPRSGSEDGWHPMSDEEMEAELDLIDAEEVEIPKPATVTKPVAASVNGVEEKILRANRLRELDNEFAARQVLYEVLEEGDADQRRVARNILRQLDEG
ncbi:twin-arginine translocase subunit TatC [Imhoffiella purpurea]|uniref:Sec-independent protein translocase protein TatC n=1 Tax=Imhoffiella purpurea TaxID=1249627 RepID=W9VMB9_9GAMM|nr:twin-arginine translocase subunit TatC [Imhoffiella purpurea]EXJ17252.1 Twin-arginine translocation protein TatC [Imhoffiella purpurea]